MKTTPPIRSLLFIAISAILLMSFVPVIIRWVNANEVTIGIVRLGIGVIGLTVFVLFSKKREQLNQHDFIWLGFLGLVFALHWFTYFKSIKMANASLASIGIATFGIHLLLLNALILKEKISITDVIAVLLSFLGIYIASPEAQIEQEKLRGFLIAIFSGFLYACLPLINRKLMHLSTNTRALGQFSFALVAFLCLIPQANFDLMLTDWQGLITLGILSTLIAHTLWIKASTELPTNITAVIYYAYVPLAIFFSYVFLHEPLTWNKIVGASLIILANVIVVLLHKHNTQNQSD